MAARGRFEGSCIFTIYFLVFLASQEFSSLATPLTAANVEDLTTTINFPFLNEDDTAEGDDPFINRLLREAQLVTGQHFIPDDFYPDISLPRLSFQEGFMHEYISSTGVGNRQVTTISEVMEVYNVDLQLENVLVWDSIRFNNTDYLLATIISGCKLWTLTRGSDDVLEVQGAPTTIIATAGIVQRCELKILNLKETESLVLSLSTRHEFGINLYIYEVINDTANHVLRETSPGAVLLSYVDAGDRHYVVSIYDGEYSSRFKSPSNFHSPKLEVSYPSPVAEVSFTTDGNGYLVLANSTGCVIIQIFEDGHPDIYDQLYQEDIVDLTSFEYHSTIYLLVSSRNVQKLFLWHVDGLMFVQTLTITAVTKAYTVQQRRCQNSIFLMVLSDSFSLRIFLWDGYKFVQENGMIRSLHLDPHSLSFLERGHDLLLIAAEGQKSRFLVFKTTSTPLENPVLDLGLKVSAEMHNLENELRKQEFRGRALWNVLSHAVLSGPEPLVFESRQILSSLKVTEKVEADVLLSKLHDVEWEGSPLTTEDLQWSVNELSALIQSLEGSLDILEEQMKDVVLRNESVFVEGRKTILGSVAAPSATVTTLTLVEAGHRNVDLTLQHLYRINEGLMISGRKILKGSLHVTENADLLRMNEISLSKNALLTSQSQVITGHWIFESPLLVDGDIEMDGRLNGIKISQDLVTLQTPNAVHICKNFSDTVRVKYSLTSSHVDGVDMEQLYLNSITRTHSQVIHVLPPVLVEVIASRITELKVSGLVNGLDIAKLGKEIARVDRPVSFTGRKTILNPNLLGGIVVLGHYDGVYLPFDIFQPQLEQEVTGRKQFEHVIVKNVVVHGLVDGINLEQDVVTLTGDQDMLEAIFAGGVTIESELSVGGTIDGVTVKNLDAIVTEPKNGSDVNVVFLKPVVVENSLVIKDVVGYDFDAIASDLVYPEDREVIFTGRKTFLEVEAKSIILNGRVNGYDINKDFVTTKTSQFVNGTKSFSRPVTFGSHVEVGSGIVDGVDLYKLSTDYISLSSSSRPLYGKVNSTNRLSVRGDLLVRGTVNGMYPLNELVLNDNHQYNLANKVFAGGLTVNGQLEIVQGHLTVGHLDGVDMDDFLKRRVTLDTQQTLHGNLVLGNSETSSLDVLLANGVNLEQFARDVMTLSTPQLVTGKKRFTGPSFVLGNVQSLEGVNGFDILGIASRAVRLDLPLTFDHHITFDHDLQVNGEMAVSDRINGVDLNKLGSQSLRKSSFLPLTGHNIFMSGLEISGDIVAIEVNGRKLSSDILLNHGDQEITGAYTFGTVRASNMTLKGLLNEIDIVQLDAETAKTNRPAIFRSDMTVLGPLRVLEGTNVIGLVNGLSLDDLWKDAVFKDHPAGTQVVAGTTIFSSSVFVKGDADFGMVHEVPLTAFLQDVVYIDQDQEIWSEKIFETTVIATAGVQAFGHTEVAGRVDGCQLEWLVENSLFIDKPAVITGDIYLEDASYINILSTTGLLNEVDLNKQVLLLNSEEPQTISGTKNFSVVMCEANMDVLGTVNGYRLPDLLEDTLLTNTDQTVHGSKTIKGQTTSMRPHFGSVNQIDLTHDVYILTEDVVFEENVVFEQDVVLQKELDLKGSINDLNLTVLCQEALMTTGEQEVLAPFLIHEVSSPNVLVEGHVSGIDMDKFLKEVKDFHSGRGQELDVLRFEAAHLSDIVDTLVGVANEGVSQLDGMVLEQNLNVSGWVLDASADQVTFLDPLDGVQLQVWTWIEGKLRFQQVRHLEDQVLFNIFNPGTDGVVSLVGKYSSASLNLDGVLARIAENAVIFSRQTNDETRSPEVTLPFPGVTGVRLFSSGGTIHALVSADSTNLCDAAAVHLLKWIAHEPVPVVIQTFPGGNIDFGVFELEGLQYILLAGTDEGTLGHTIKVYHRKCACDDGIFSLLSREATPNVLSSEVFSLENMVYLVWANRTWVQVSRFSGLEGFKDVLSMMVAHVLNVRVVFVHNQLYLLVGQAADTATNLLLKAIWNGPIPRPQHFRRWL